MSTSTIAVQPSPPAGSTVGRCLELRPTLAQLGLPTIVLGIGRAVIGSGQTSDVVLPVEGVAERHCEIQFNGRDALLRVISPLTWLNNGPIREARLRTGDIVTLGPVELEAAFVDVPLPPPLTEPVTRDVAPSPRQSDAPVTKQRTRPRRTRRTRPSETLRTSGDDQVVQPLLDDAEAGRRLRRDLERLEREAAWHRRQAAAAFASPTPSRPRSDAADQLQRQLTERELDLSRREQAQAQAERRVADGARELQQQYTKFEQERHTVAEQLRDVQLERKSLQAASVARRQAEATEQTHRAELQREQIRLADCSRRLQTQRCELDARQAALDQRHSEFESAVEALDADRVLLQRNRDALHTEAAHTLREAEQLRLRITAAESALADREAAVLNHGQRLSAQLAELEARQQQEAERQRRSDEELATRRRALEQREATAQSRDQALTARETGLRQQSEQAAVEAARQCIEREELDIDRTTLERARQEIARLRASVADDQERLRCQRQSYAQQSEQWAHEQQHLQAQRNRWEQMGLEVQEQQSDLARRESELRIAQGELENQRQALARRQAVQDAESQQLAERAADVSSRHAAADASILELQTELEQDRKRLASARAEVVQLEQHLLAEADRLRRKETELGDLEQGRPSPDTASPAADLVAREQRLAAAEADLLRREEELALEQSRQSSALTMSVCAVPSGVPESAELLTLHAAAATTAEAAATALRHALDDVTAERDRLRDEIDQLYRDARTSADIPTRENDSATAELSRRQHELEASEQELQAAARQLQEQWTAFDDAAARMELERRELSELRDALQAERAALDLATQATAAPLNFSHWSDTAHDETPPSRNAPIHDAPRAVETHDAGDVPTPVAPLTDWTPLACEYDAVPAADHFSGEPEPDLRPVELSGTAAAPAEQSTGIRSQLAALFGINPTELDATAAKHGESDDIPTQYARPVESESRQTTSVAASSEVVPEDLAALSAAPLPGVDPDSIAAYMQRLLPQTPTEAPSSGSPSHTAELLPAQSSGVSESPTPERLDTGRGARRAEETDVVEQRAQMDSMRQIANLSARAAVATHYSRKLQLTYQVMLTLTVVGAVLSLGLFGMGFVTQSSYEVQALGASVVTLITGLELARTLLRIRQVRRIVESAAAGGSSISITNESAAAAK